MSAALALTNAGTGRQPFDQTVDCRMQRHWAWRMPYSLLRMQLQWRGGWLW